MSSGLRESLRTLIEESVDQEGQRSILTDYDLNRIIAAVREALLSDTAVKEVCRSLTHLHPWGVRDVLTAALDAAFGEGDDDDMTPEPHGAASEGEAE